jgi:hypothetical protein
LKYEKVFFLTVVQIRLHNREVDTTKMRPAVVRGIKKSKETETLNFLFFQTKIFFLPGRCGSRLSRSFSCCN